MKLGSLLFNKSAPACVGCVCQSMYVITFILEADGPRWSHLALFWAHRDLRDRSRNTEMRIAPASCDRRPMCDVTRTMSWRWRR